MQVAASENAVHGIVDEFLTTVVVADGVPEGVARRRQFAAFAEVAGPDPTPEFDPSWRTVTAVGMARAMYDGRDFANAPILADALQEAGCDVAELLAHLRGDGPHFRGCWAVDRVLGRG